MAVGSTLTSSPAAPSKTFHWLSWSNNGVMSIRDGDDVSVGGSIRGDEANGTSCHRVLGSNAAGCEGKGASLKMGLG
jgi:hypothetical protein